MEKKSGGMRPGLAATLTLIYCTLLFCIGMVNSAGMSSLSFAAAGVPLVVLALFLGHPAIWRMVQATIALIIIDQAVAYGANALLHILPGVVCFVMIQLAIPKKKKRT